MALALSAFVTARADNSSFVVNSWSVEDGLPDNEAIAVIQGSNGYLWIGTQHGLVRFDGHQFTVFNQMNTPGLNSDLVTFLFQDNQSNLWFATGSDGLEMVSNGVVHDFSAATSGGGKVAYAAGDSSGDVLFYTAAGLSRYHTGTVIYFFLLSQQLAQLYLSARVLRFRKDLSFLRTSKRRLLATF